MCFMHVFIDAFNTSWGGGLLTTSVFKRVSRAGPGGEASKGLSGAAGTDVISAAHSQVHLLTMRSVFCMLMTWKIKSNV